MKPLNHISLGFVLTRHSRLWFGSAGFRLAAFTLFAFATGGHAAVTNVAWYRLGEMDPGAVSGHVVNSTTLDLLGMNHLKRIGSPLYTNAVSKAAGQIGSSLAVQFNGVNQFCSNAVVTTARNNFGIEAWVATLGAANGTYIIAHNGNAAANGWGLSVEVTNRPLFGTSVAYFGELAGGITVGGGSPRAPDAWTHVALVRDNGISTFYLNGVASGPTTNRSPSAPSGAFAIAARPQLPGAFFPGFVDEVRVFTFAPGEFGPDDLLLSQRRAITAQASDFAPGSATLHGTAGTYGLASAAWFEWGTTTNLGEVTPPQILDGSQVTTANFSQVLTGLTSGSTYFFRAVASNDLGLATGSTLLFSTRASVETLPAADLGPTAATFNGLGNTKGWPANGWFEWGTTTNYGDTTPPQPLAGAGGPATFSNTVANLFPGGTFHFRAVLSNANEVVTGENQTFTTPVDASVDRVISGAVTVTIQPPEAAADGARWTLDNGPAMFSGLVLPLVTPGHHTVRFRNLGSWREPLPLDVYVVGGKNSEVTVAFTPIPTFDFHDVPEQQVRLGDTVEFTVTGTPSPTLLQVTAVPAVAGSLTFDPVTGRVTYIPAAADRLPFTLTFSLSGMPVASTTITPQESLPTEDVVIDYDRPLPDEESRDYITISETLSAAPELFNNVSNRVLTVDISGKTLVFDAAHSAHLHPQYNARENIKEFRLFADRVIIRSPLVLPQTHVSIHARELRFEGNGVLNTTPLARWLKPEGISPLAWSSNVFTALPGMAGHNGGDADVFVERFHADPSPTNRFILNGGAGGPPGEGRDGYSEGVGFPDPATGGTTYFPFFLGDTNWDRLMFRCGNNTNCGIANNGLILYSETFFNGVLSTNFICGDSNALARGEPAVPSGLPGAGGGGGTLRSTLDLSAYASQSGGAAGARGSNYAGGTLFFQYLYRSIFNQTVHGVTTVTTDLRAAPKVPGANAPAPTNTNGSSGSFVLIPDPSAWLHSFGLRSIVRFAKDAYLNDRVAETRALLAEYRDILRVLQPIVVNVTNLTDAEFAETTSLDQLTLEMGSIVDRIDMNLDFFGNPAGWVPMLSFEANLTAFQNEINESIPILYLTYWLNYSATNLQNSAAASEVAAQKLREEFDRFVQAYNAAQLIIPVLKLRAADINNRIGVLRINLSNLEAQLTARAQQNVEDRHKLPFWKKALGVLAVAADLVPIGQPTVGKVGAGLELLTKVDPDHPVQSALAITNAFDVLKNKDISLCFGGSTTNGTNHTSGSTTNSAAKRQDLKVDSQCASFLQGELKELVGVFKEVQVDSKELQAEIQKLEAADPVFLETSAELVALNKDKQRFAADLAAALAAVATLTAEMTENTLATDQLENRVAQQLTALDHNALVHIKEMERRAKERLLKFQYFTAKAFQYRLLRPFNGNLQLNTLFDRFQAIVAGTNAHILSPEEFANLKNLFQDDLANTTDLAMTALNDNAPQHAQPRTFELSAGELQTLNTNGQVTIDLKNHALFPSFHEDIRIVNLRVTNIAAHPVGGSIGGDAVLFIDLNHLGESRVTGGGQNFLFRHYQTETVSPIAWNAVLDVVHHTTNNSVLSASSDSILRALLRQPTDANMLLFSRPAADAEILIRREAVTDNGIDLALDGLTIVVDYEFAQQSLSQRTLDVKVADDLLPVILLSQPDVNGRRDGSGDFRRVYPANVAVALQAPALYSGRPFDHWIVNNVPRPDGANTITVTLTTGTTAEAHYGAVPISTPTPTLTPLPPAPGVVGFRFGTISGVNYILEQKLTLSDPVWTPVETLPGTGGVLQFTRPTTNGFSFFRLRVD